MLGMARPVRKKLLPNTAHGSFWARPCRARHGHGKPFTVPSPLPDDSPESLTPLYHSLFSSFPSPPHPVSRASLSHLLYDSLSLSAWKTTGFSTWSLRINPSSGNLHPTEAHLLSLPFPNGDSPFSSSFLTHYSPKDHSLELHARLDLSSLFPEHGGSVLLLAFSSIFWREAWKYGERALRYCNHNIGHALAAASLGWYARLLDGLGHNDLGLLLGLHRANPPPPSHLPVRDRFPWIESQHLDCALLLFPFGSAPLWVVPCRTNGPDFLSPAWLGLMGRAGTVQCPTLAGSNVTLTWPKKMNGSRGDGSGIQWWHRFPKSPAF